MSLCEIAREINIAPVCTTELVLYSCVADNAIYPHDELSLARFTAITNIDQVIHIDATLCRLYKPIQH